MSASRTGRRARSAARTRFRAHVVFVAIVVAVLAGATAQAQRHPASGIDAFVGASRYDPRLRFRTIVHRAIRHSFPPGRGGARAPARARSRRRSPVSIDARLGAPRGRVHVILVDQTDQCRTAGRRLFPYNLIELAAAAPRAAKPSSATPTTGCGSCSPTSTRTSSTSRSRVAGSAACAACSDGARCSTRTCSSRCGRSRESRPTKRARQRRRAGARRRLPHDSRSRRGGTSLRAARPRGGRSWWTGPPATQPYVYGAYFHDYLASRYRRRVARGAWRTTTSGRLPYFGVAGISDGVRALTRRCSGRTSRAIRESFARAESGRVRAR